MKYLRDDQLAIEGVVNGVAVYCANDVVVERCYWGEEIEVVKDFYLHELDKLTKVYEILVLDYRNVVTRMEEAEARVRELEQRCPYFDPSAYKGCKQRKELKQ